MMEAGQADRQIKRKDSNTVLFETLKKDIITLFLLFLLLLFAVLHKNEAS